MWVSFRCFCFLWPIACDKSLRYVDWRLYCTYHINVAVQTYFIIYVANWTDMPYYFIECVFECKVFGRCSLGCVWFHAIICDTRTFINAFKSFDALLFQRCWNPQFARRVSRGQLRQCCVRRTCRLRGSKSRLWKWKMDQVSSVIVYYTCLLQCFRQFLIERATTGVCQWVQGRPVRRLIDCECDGRSSIYIIFEFLADEGAFESVRLGCGFHVITAMSELKFCHVRRLVRGW